MMKPYINLIWVVDQLNNYFSSLFHIFFSHLSGCCSSPFLCSLTPFLHFLSPSPCLSLVPIPTGDLPAPIDVEHQLW